MCMKNTPNKEASKIIEREVLCTAKKRIHSHVKWHVDELCVTVYWWGLLSP